MAMGSKEPITLFLSYSQKDEALKQEFEDYLVNLRQARLISGWIEREVQPGGDWSEMIDPRLEETQLFVLLLSPSLLASGYCSGAEFREIWQRRERGDGLVCPIMLHRVDLTGYPLQSFMWIPRGGRPVASWRVRSEAWASIYEDIRWLAARRF